MNSQNIDNECRLSSVESLSLFSLIIYSDITETARPYSSLQTLTIYFLHVFFVCSLNSK